MRRRSDNNEVPFRFALRPLDRQAWMLVAMVIVGLYLIVAVASLGVPHRLNTKEWVGRFQLWWFNLYVCWGPPVPPGGFLWCSEWFCVAGVGPLFF